LPVAKACGGGSRVAPQAAASILTRNGAPSPPALSSARSRSGVHGCNDSIAERARRKSLCGASTTTLVSVGLWIVVIWPWRTPTAS
jgi:hypothetical protein